MKRALCLVLFCFGCATARHGGIQRIPVTSEPTGAAVRVDCGGEPRDGGVTPTTVSVTRRSTSCRLHFTHAGYEDTSISLDRRPDAYFWGNFGIGAIAAAAMGTSEVAGAGLLGGAGIGVLVDWMSGSMWTQQPQQVSVTLKKR